MAQDFGLRLIINEPNLVLHFFCDFQGQSQNGSRDPGVSSVLIDVIFSLSQKYDFGGHFLVSVSYFGYDTPLLWIKEGLMSKETSFDIQKLKTELENIKLSHFYNSFT